jgi:hypothetical protein
VVGGCWFLVLALVYWIRVGFTRWPAFILSVAVVLFGLAIWMHRRAEVADRTHVPTTDASEDME